MLTSLAGLLVCNPQNRVFLAFETYVAVGLKHKAGGYRATKSISLSATSSYMYTIILLRR